MLKCYVWAAANCSKEGKESRDRHRGATCCDVNGQVLRTVTRWQTSLVPILLSCKVSHPTNVTGS